MQNAFITLDHLTQLGINLEGKDIDSLLKHLNDTLQERVGTEVTESLNDDQLKELLAVQENSNDEEVGAWLSNNVPELQEITQDEIDILLGELAENSDEVNQAS